MAGELDNYVHTLEEIKEQIYQAQNRAMQVVNTELISLYWNIGKIISAKQADDGWGQATVEQLSKDLLRI